MARLIIGFIVGILLSFISVSLFDMWSTFAFAISFFPSNIFKMLKTFVGANFEFDIIGYFRSGLFDITLLFVPALLACLLVGFVSGTISKGLRGGVISSFLVIIIDILLWILFNIFSGEDLMALFQGNQLIVTIGGILGAFAGSLLGGALGGVASGPPAEF